MTQPGFGTFDLGMLDKGTGVEVVLMTPAKIRLVPSETVTALDAESPDLRKRAYRRPMRRFKVPYSGHWRILVEHADDKRKGGCSIRLTDPLNRGAGMAQA